MQPPPPPNKESDGVRTKMQYRLILFKHGQNRVAGILQYVVDAFLNGGGSAGDPCPQLPNYFVIQFLVQAIDLARDRRWMHSRAFRDGGGLHCVDVSGYKEAPFFRR